MRLRIQKDSMFWPILVVFVAVLLAAGTYIAASAHDLLARGEILQRILLLSGTLALFVAIGFPVLHVIQNGQAAEQSRWFWPAAAGGLTFAITMVSHFFTGMWPFGPNTCIMIDMYSQYMPLLAYFRSAILGEGGSLLYSTEMGIGISMVPTIGYYLASPLNLISVLFPEEYMAECFLTIITIKTVVSAVTFAFLMQYLTGRRSAVSAITALIYATSMYFVAYSWNFMWFDVVMLLPLAVLFLEKLLREGKCLAYTLILGYCLFANFYAAYMLCIFLGLYFFVFCIREKTRRFFPLLLRFALCSILGVLLSCVMVLPTYYGLQVTSAAGETMPALKTNFSPLEFLARQFFGVIPTELHVTDLPNIACGALPLLAIPLYATTGRIPLRRRLSYLALWLILALSMIFNIPDRVWHGFHGPNGLPYRYAFLYVFVLALMTGDVLTHLKDLKLPQIFLSGAALLGYIALMMKLSTQKIPMYSFLVTAALLLLYVAILALAASRRARIVSVTAFLLFAITAESLFSVDETRGELLNEGFTTSHSGYLLGSSHQLLGEIGQEAVKYGESEGIPFFRVDTSNRFTNMDGALYNFNCFNIFASTYYNGTTQALRHLGFSCNTVNSHRMLTYLPTIDALFGVRYYISSSDLSAEPSLSFLESMTKSGTTYNLYENPDALSIGYLGTSSLKSWKSPVRNPVAAQNSLYAALTGDSEPVLELNTKAVSSSGSSMGVTSRADGVSYTFDGGTTPGEITMTVTTTGPVYIFVDRNSEYEINVDGAIRQMDVTSQNTFLSCGNRSAGETIKVKVTSDKRVSGTIYLVTLNQEAYRKAVDKLAAQQLNLDSYNHTSLSGTITAPEDGTFFSTISYDVGWEAYVDGVKVETYSIDDGYLGFDLPAGTHQVSLKFRTHGLKQGALLSLAGLAGLLILLLLRRRHGFWKPDETLPAAFGPAYDVPDKPAPPEEDLALDPPGDLTGPDVIPEEPESPETPAAPDAPDREGEDAT